jgi:hypothetical protein
MAKIVFVAGTKLLEKLSGVPIDGDIVFGSHSGGSASGVSTVAIAIGVWIIAEGRKPGGTPGEG